MRCPCPILFIRVGGQKGWETTNLTSPHVPHPFRPKEFDEALPAMLH